MVDHPGVTVCDIMMNYPDGNIDVAAEQKRLTEASLLIFQFPFVWYGMPSHMKGWLEKVLSFGFAFGPGGDKLKGKKIFFSITLGGSSAAYSAHGQHLYPVETFLRPLELLVKYCGMQYLPPVYSYEMAATEQTKNQVMEKGRLHAQRLISIIHSLEVPAEKNHYLKLPAGSKLQEQQTS